MAKKENRVHRIVNGIMRANKKVRIIVGSRKVHLVWDADDVDLKACDNRNPINHLEAVNGKLKDVTCKSCIRAERRLWTSLAVLGQKMRSSGGVGNHYLQHCCPPAR
jgi:hypothetical protein